MNRHVALVVAFIVGALAMGLAGSLSGLFDRGPTQQDVVASREAGFAAAEEATAQRMQLEADRQESAGYQRGLLATEAAPLLDYLPNPSGLIAGAIAGRDDLDEGYEQLTEDAWDDGWTAGYDVGVHDAWFDLVAGGP